MRLNESVSSTLRACLAVLGFTARRPPMRFACALLSTAFLILTMTANAQAAPAGENKLEQAFPHAFAKRGCTQEDAPALEIYLTKTALNGAGEPSPPYIRVEISSSPTEVIGPASMSLIQ